MELPGPSEELSLRLWKAWILVAGPEWANSGTEDALHFMGLGVGYDSHAGTAVAIASVRIDPVLPIEVGPFALGLMPALSSDDPLSILVSEPRIARGRVLKPAAPGDWLRLNLSNCCGRLSAERTDYYGHKDQASSDEVLGRWGLHNRFVKGSQFGLRGRNRHGVWPRGG